MQSCDLQLFCVGFNSMPNLIVISSIIFFLYVCGFQIVSDECKRVWKLKLQRMNKWFSWVSCEKLTRERAKCRAHARKIKSHARLEIFTSVLQVRPTRKGLVNSLFGKKWDLSLPSLYPHYIYHHCKECFLERKP